MFKRKFCSRNLVPGTSAAHTLGKAFRSRKILIVDGDQNKVGNGHRDVLLSRFGEIHVFRNRTNTEIQQRQDVDATWCRYHESPSGEKEAVDHNITFFCGQHYREWLKDKVSVAIVSKDRTFRNTKSLLEREGVSCDIYPDVPSMKKLQDRNLGKR